MGKKIIKLPIGSMINYFHSSRLQIDDSGEYIGFSNNNKKDRQTTKLTKNKYTMFYMVLFFIFGLPLAIIIPYKTFTFFYKKTGIDMFDHSIYKVNKKSIMIIGFLILYFTISLLTPFIMFTHYFSDDGEHYDWGYLYNSIKENGYQPEKYGYIVVRKLKNSENFICYDGNHRHKVLQTIYPKDKLVDVILVE